MKAEPAVLDASAALAYIQREPGWEAVAAALAVEAAISAVNLAEVHGHLSARERDADGMVARLKALGLAVEPFLERDATVVGSLYLRTRDLGLSLADRACLALATRLGLRVLTADRAWRSVDANVQIDLVR